MINKSAMLISAYACLIAMVFAQECSIVSFDRDSLVCAMNESGVYVGIEVATKPSGPWQPVLTCWNVKTGEAGCPVTLPMNALEDAGVCNDCLFIRINWSPTPLLPSKIKSITTTANQGIDNTKTITAATNPNTDTLEHQLETITNPDVFHDQSELHEEIPNTNACTYDEQYFINTFWHIEGSSDDMPYVNFRSNNECLFATNPSFYWHPCQWQVKDGYVHFFGVHPWGHQLKISQGNPPVLEGTWLKNEGVRAVRLSEEVQGRRFRTMIIPWRILHTQLAEEHDLRWVYIVLYSGLVHPSNDEWISQHASFVRSCLNGDPDQIFELPTGVGFIGEDVNFRTVVSLAGEADSITQLPNKDLLWHKFGPAGVIVNTNNNLVVSLQVPIGWAEEGLNKRAEEALQAFTEQYLAELSGEPLSSDSLEKHGEIGILPTNREQDSQEGNK